MALEFAGAANGNGNTSDFEAEPVDFKWDRDQGGRAEIPFQRGHFFPPECDLPPETTECEKQWKSALHPQFFHEATERTQGEFWGKKKGIVFRGPRDKKAD